MMIGDPRLSRRTAWPVAQNEWTQAAAVLRQSGPGVVDLTLSNPTQCGWTAPGCEWVLPATYKPEPLGFREARIAIANYHRSHDGEVDPEQVWLASGTSELYAQLMAITADPGDIWLVPQPGYPLFNFIADLSGIELVHYPLLFDGEWRMDLDGLRQALETHPRARAIVTVSPHNPTGHVLSESERHHIAQLGCEFGVTWVVDEVFLDYPLRHSDVLPTCARPQDALTVTLSGLSKVAALPQAKIAWAVVTGPNDGVGEVLRRAEWIDDTFLTLTAAIQAQVPALLQAAPPRQQSIRDRCRTNLATAIHLLRDSAATPIPTAAGWALLIRFPATRTDEEWALDVLHKGRVLIQPGCWYDLDSALSAPHAVVSLLTPTDLFRMGMQAVVDRVSG